MEEVTVTTSAGSSFYLSFLSLRPRIHSRGGLLVQKPFANVPSRASQSQAAEKTKTSHSSDNQICLTYGKSSHRRRRPKPCTALITRFVLSMENPAIVGGSPVCPKARQTLYAMRTMSHPLLVAQWQGDIYSEPVTFSHTVPLQSETQLVAGDSEDQTPLPLRTIS